MQLDWTCKYVTKTLFGPLIYLILVKSMLSEPLYSSVYNPRQILDPRREILSKASSGPERLEPHG